jgi:glycosyltransferase involved in cell wall biosynthesis
MHYTATTVCAAVAPTNADRLCLRSSMLSIVHVLSSFGVGGQERVALDLAIGQKKAGHRVAVLSMASVPDGPLEDEFNSAGIPTLREEKRGDGIDFTLTRRLVSTLRSHGVDVVHTHNPLPLIYAAPAARLIGAAAIHTKHGLNVASRKNRLLRRIASEAVHSFVAVSEMTAEQTLAQHDCRASKLHTIANGIRLERYFPDAKSRSEVRAELGLGDAWVVGTVGRLVEVKNQAMLIRAMAPLLSKDCRLVIVGDGPARPALEAEIGRLPNPSWCVLAGRRMDVPRVMPAFDVFALSSISEGLPLVVPEAMSAGLPVVATDVGGLPTVIDEDVTGRLVPVDEIAMRNALSEMHNDKARSKAMGAAARKAAHSRFSAERMVAEYQKLYDAALGK